MQSSSLSMSFGTLKLWNPGTLNLWLRRLSGLPILRTGREHVTAVWECHPASRGVERSVLGAEALDEDRLAELQLVFRDAPAHQLSGSSTSEPPGRHRSIGIFHVDVEPDVWVLPFDVGDGPSDLHRFGVVELSRN